MCQTSLGYHFERDLTSLICHLKYLARWTFTICMNLRISIDVIMRMENKHEFRKNSDCILSPGIWHVLLFSSFLCWIIVIFIIAFIYICNEWIAIPLWISFSLKFNSISIYSFIFCMFYSLFIAFQAISVRRTKKIQSKIVCINF